MTPIEYRAVDGIARGYCDTSVVSKSEAIVFGRVFCEPQESYATKGDFADCLKDDLSLSSMSASPIERNDSLGSTFSIFDDGEID